MSKDWSDLTATEIDEAIKLYETKNLEGLKGLADELGTTPETLARQIRGARMVRDKYKPLYMIESIPESPSPLYEDFTVVRGDNIILISDIEIPDHDPAVLRRALLVGMRYGIRKIALGGDVIATDQDSLNTWLTTWAEEHECTYAKALKELKQIVRAFADWFTEGVYFIVGNHDERLAKKTGGEVTLQMLLEGEPITTSMYSYMYIYSPTKDEYTYLCHQYNYSKTPVKLAQDVWAVETAPDGSRSKMHIVVTHTHIEQTGWSPDGEWRCISMGCARDPKRTKYARTRATKFPKWNQSFVMIKGGYHHSLTMKGTDWQDVLGPDYYRILQGEK